jgi:peptide deformylase
MALRRILHDGDEALRKRSKEVTAFDDKLWVLLDDMKETMAHANGVGLAAPQIGILRRVVVIDVGDGVIELINPVITEEHGSQKRMEGCLSVPDKWGYVKRPEKVTVKAQNRYGKDVEYSGTDLFAVAVCHEVDHLDGVLFTDKAYEMVDPHDEEK